MQNLTVMFTFFVFDWKHLFWVNLVQKIKIFSLGRNLVPRLIQICRIQWWCSLFCLRLEIPFLVKCGLKFKIFSLNWNLVSQTIWICKIPWWCSPFLFCTDNTLFGQIRSKKSKSLGSLLAETQSQWLFLF